MEEMEDMEEMAKLTNVEIPETEFMIGESSTRMVTKQELMEIIDRTFTEDDVRTIAVITTIKSNIDYKKVAGQSIAFGKFLKV